MGCIAKCRERLNALATALDVMSPLKVLGRGYAIPRRRDGTVLTSVANAVPGDPFFLRLADGELGCRVEENL